MKKLISISIFSATFFGCGIIEPSLPLCNSLDGPLDDLGDALGCMSEEWYCKNEC